MFPLTANEKAEVVTDCDHLSRLTTGGLNLLVKLRAESANG